VFVQELALPQPSDLLEAARQQHTQPQVTSHLL
jgi:hypothetical protein